MIFQYLLEQLFGQASPGPDRSGVHSRHHAILCKSRPLEVAFLGNGGLVMKQTPQPRHVDPVSGKVIHETQHKFVIINRRREVTIENLEGIVRRHVERVLDVFDRNLTLGHAVNGLPKFLREEFLRSGHHVLGDDPRCDFALLVQ